MDGIKSFLCGSRYNAWLCTREPGHTGKHQCNNGITWANAEADTNEPVVFQKPGLQRAIGDTTTPLQPPYASFCPQCGARATEASIDGVAGGQQGVWYSCPQHSWYHALPPDLDRQMREAYAAPLAALPDPSEGAENRFHRSGVDRIEVRDWVAPNLREYLNRKGESL